MLIYICTYLSIYIYAHLYAYIDTDGIIKTLISVLHSFLFKSFKINCSKAKRPERWPEVVFVCLRHYSMEEKNHFSSFPKTVEKLEIATAIEYILNLRHCVLTLLK